MGRPTVRSGAGMVGRGRYLKENLGDKSTSERSSAVVDELRPTRVISVSTTSCDQDPRLLRHAGNDLI